MKVYFVGAGPGDPDLITVKGADLITRADIIIYAGSLVPPEIFETRNKTARIYNSASMNLEQVTAVYLENKEKPGIIVRLHTGDPSLYGAIQEQIDFLKENSIDFQVVPGISSFQAAAAAMGRQLTLAGVSQSVIITRAEGRTKLPPSEDLSILAKAKTTMVLFLSVDKPRRIMEKLIPEYGEQTPVAIVYRVGWPQEKIVYGHLAELDKLVEDNKIERQALIFIGNFLSSDSEGYEKSRLYAREFSHGFRKADNTDG